MGLINEEIFVCFDCEMTGLDVDKDRIIEIAAIRFSFKETYEAFESLIDPLCPIPDESIKIHHITDEMVKGKPKIKEILPSFLNFIEGYTLIGHGITFDIALINKTAKELGIPCSINKHPFIDTLRLARLYGESESNSLEKLREHFNIPSQGAHRAMQDVTVNIKIFKHLVKSFKTTRELLNRLRKPILLKKMPLGKHKKRPFNEIPIEYLLWAAKQDFDQDLLFSIRSEIKNRKKGKLFYQSVNPFSEL